MNNCENVKQSFARCMIKGDVVGRFYEIFLASHPDIKPRFTNIVRKSSGNFIPRIVEKPER